MDKLKMQTPNKVDENVERIAALFPNCMTESIGADGKPIRVVDFDLLRQELSGFAVEGQEERYQFTWADKKKSILLANSPISKTLRPCREESVDFDPTKNLYIEGDNLDVLKLLQETYMGKVKLIYIDPPYNTGGDIFVYNDNMDITAAEFAERSGLRDEDSNIQYDIRENNESNGRFHTDWLNMMYPRIKLSRDLLTEDGVVFISIDDREVDNLKKICNEVFSEHNFIACIVWERAFSPVNLKRHFSESHDFILCYARDIDALNCYGLKRSDEANDRYSNPDNDSRGEWTSGDISVGPAIQEKIYEIATPSGRKILPPKGYCWRFSQAKLAELIKDNRIWFGEKGDNTPRYKRFLSEVKQGITPMTIWKYTEVGHSQDATKALKELFDGEAYFDYPKPVELIKRILSLYTKDTDLIIDFFSGSATTAHAVLQLNAEDGGNRKFIMVQLPEETSVKSDAFKAGYRTICDIGKDRIRRAGKRVADANRMLAPNLDIGFRVLKLDSSNMKPVFYNPEAVTQNLFTQQNLADNIKDDRTPEDLLFQVMLDMGVDLSSPITVEALGGKKVLTVSGDNLICCFDKDITKETVTEIAKRKPLYAVFRDSSFARDDVMVSFDQIFETYSPTTTRRVI